MPQTQEKPASSHEAPPETPPPSKPTSQSGRTSRLSLVFIGVAILFSGVVLTYAGYRMTYEEAARQHREAGAVVDSAARAENQKAAHKLTKFGAVNADQGVYRIPIDRAKRLMLQETHSAKKSTGRRTRSGTNVNS